MAGKFLPLAWNSLTLATLAACPDRGLRRARRPMVFGFETECLSMKVASSVAGLGYAIPGTVIAVGVLIPFALI